MTLVAKPRGCIWCLNASNDRDIEHIFPEALGCPEHLTLPGTVVCRKCNNGLAHLDQVVADDYDVVCVMLGINRKRGRPASISSRGNMGGLHTPHGPELFLNCDPVPREFPGGHKIGPYRGRDRDVTASVKHHYSGLSTVSVSHTVGQHKKFPRGLYKIALSSIAFCYGHDFALENRFDWIREYVLHGGQRRRIILTRSPGADSQFNTSELFLGPEDALAIEIKISSTNFVLDLSPKEIWVADLFSLLQESLGPNNICSIPPFT